MKNVSPKENSITYPLTGIFLPYHTVQPSTLISLIGYNYTPVPTIQDLDYSQYFKKRWEEGKTFINVEQDIVVYPDALEKIAQCSNFWCMYDFHLPNHKMRSLADEKEGVPIGCVKISSEAIEKTPGIWDVPREWIQCELHLTKSLIDAGFTPHQHYPSVVNANPALLGFVNYKEDN